MSNDVNASGPPGRERLGPDSVLLGTVALEPNRWGLLSADRRPRLRAADWLGRAEQAGFDGIELWENHATCVDASELARLESSPLPVSIWNTYVAFEDEDDAARDAVAGWVVRLAPVGVKFNVGSDAGAVVAYARRVARFAEKLPARTRLLCECHEGTVAFDPRVALEILGAAGAADRLQALVHLGDDFDHLDSMFGVLGDRIAHVHVNFLRQGAPPLSVIADDVRARVDHVRRQGFVGSYTIEFVNGVGTERDEPSALVDAALRDLASLREALGGGGLSRVGPARSGRAG